MNIIFIYVFWRIFVISSLTTNYHSWNNNIEAKLKSKLPYKKYSCLKANFKSLIITTKTQPKIEFKKVSLIVSAVKMLGYYCTTHNWNLFRFKVWFFNLTMTRALSSHAHAVRVTYANRNRRGQNQLAYTIS